jgi:hypothetical protein
MEEDRVVVREPPPPPVVALPKKKRFSWFSRNKSTPPENVSTTNLEAPTVRARTVSTSIPEKDDDDLPERIALPASPMPGGPQSPTPPPYSSSLSAQSASAFPSEKTGLPIAIVPESSAAPEIAPTAGFDFKAIGEVLGKADLDPNKIRMPQPSPAMKSRLMASPRNETSDISRSESAPPSATQVVVDPPERETTPKPRSHARAQTEYGADVLGGFTESSEARTTVPLDDEGEEDVTTMFRRSVSLDATSGLGLNSGAGGFEGGYMGDTFAGGSNGFGSSSSRITNESALSFGSADGSVWTPPTNPFATPSSRSLPGVGGLGSPFSGTYVPPTPPNPFSDSTLSFGGTDASITSWPPQPKKTSTLPSNPWEM